MPTDISKASNDKLVKYYFTLEAARWEDAAGSPNGRKLYEYYCFKRQFDRIAWGGSRDQIIAGLQQVLEDEFKTASINYKKYDPEGVFGFVLGILLVGSATINSFFCC